jgi:AGCS family alanine or glycine:cation symporter
MSILEFLNTYLLGTCLPPFLLAAGLFFGVRLSFFPFRHPIRTVKKMGNGDLRSSLSALSVALAGTLGVGNIAGVGLALSVGGAGAILWMIVGGIAVALLKYGEIALALDARRGESRGALDYIGPTLGRGTALLFAVLSLFLALSMGSLLQGNVIAEATAAIAPLHPLSVGIFLSAVTLLLFLGGRRVIERITAVSIPILTVLYTLAAFIVIFVNITSLPTVISRILCEAFSLQSAGGGLLGLGFVRGMRAGIQKGLFSNEAGAGTAPFAHGNASTPPAIQGIFGIAEVMTDTVLMCTLTGVAILSVFPTLPSLSGTALVAAAFAAVFGEVAEGMVTLAIVLFSYATVACWVSYGLTALGHLTKGRTAAALFALCFSAAMAVGALVPPHGAWALADLILGAMTFINTAALLKSRKRIRAITEEAGLL